MSRRYHVYTTIKRPGTSTQVAYNLKRSSTTVNMLKRITRR